jgi:geranylgeranyl diphosphate synthase, type II
LPSNLSGAAATRTLLSEARMAPKALDFVQQVLAEDHRSVRAAFKRAIPTEEPRRHLYDLIEEYQQRSGKGFRASLCLACCRAFGGRSEEATEAAVALEFLHSAFLIHDDIEDRSLQRRGRPALHHSHGVALALNAGDGLCALALTELARCAARQPTEVGAALLAELAHLFRRTVEGQALELGWIADQAFDVTEADYLKMVLGKTCWYSTIHPCRIGALIGSRGRVPLDALVPFGVYLGTAFQIRDDLENLASTDSTYGKDLGGDILEGKRTLPLLHVLSHAGDADRREVERLIAGQGPETARERIDRVLALMREQGSLEYAQAAAGTFARLAMTEAPRAFRGASSLADVDYICALAQHLSGAVAQAAA